jgi:hypothetical protein
VAEQGRGGEQANEPQPVGATEPITLTDPDGAVTRVAPWSSWTREQVRAPGGEPALVTRLDQGQLWFSAGRRRSPWRHEVHVGPAVISTPRGRFHAIAEADGGATVACLAGRTRVVAGLREPVLLGPDQSAAVSADGRTLVVMDRAAVEAALDPEVLDLTGAEPAVDLTGVEQGVPRAATLAAVGSSERGGAPGLPSAPSSSPDPSASDAPEPDADDVAEPEPVDRRPARLGWIPELVAVLALVALLVAAVWVFSRDSSEVETTTPPTTEALPVDDVTEAPTTAVPTTAIPTTTEAPTTTTTTAPPRPASSATAVGELSSCRRSPAGVTAAVVVSHRSGPASAFRVTTELIDDGGGSLASGTADSPVIQPGGTATVDVEVAVDGEITGSCELASVIGI